jgi:DNA-directed RNA polymerase subunit RPC12/RpoP
MKKKINEQLYVYRCLKCNTETLLTKYSDKMCAHCQNKNLYLVSKIEKVI